MGGTFLTQSCVVDGNFQILNDVNLGSTLYLKYFWTTSTVNGPSSRRRALALDVEGL